MMAVFCGVTALGGHLWPIYLRFKGGKGVATAAGILFAMNWMAGLIAFGVWLLVFVPFRYVSLASIAASLVLPIAQYFTGSRPQFWGHMHWPVTVFCAMAAVIVILRHQDNMKRLLRGEEKKFGFRKEETA